MAATLSIKLLTKADWPEWYSTVTSIATRDGIWDYCNPDLPETAPASASSTTATTTATTTAPTTAATNTLLAHRELVEPTRPRPSDIDSDATQLGDLDSDDFKKWALVKEDFNERMRDYKEKRKAIADLDNYIISTLDRSNYTIIRNLHTPYKKLKALKQKLEPTSIQLKQAARAAYEQAQKWNSRVKLEQWLRTYRNAHSDAVAAKLSMIEDYNPHLAFVNAIAQVNPACSSALHSLLVQREQRGEDPPDFATSCLEFFETWQNNELAAQPGVTHTGFATFQGQPLHSTQPNAQPGHQSASQTRGRGRGQYRGNQPTRTPCKFCGGRHASERCYYVDPRQRPATWKELPWLREKYNQNLANNAALREEAEAIRSRPVPTSQNQAQPSTSPSYPTTTPAVWNNPGNALAGTKHSAAVSAAAVDAEEAHELENSLLHCWILDPGADVNVSNNLADFTWERPALPTDQLMAGGTYLKIQAWGRATITVRGPHGPTPLVLHQVAYIPSFFTSLVSLSQGKGLHFDSGQNLVYMGEEDRIPFCYTTRRGGHWVMMARDRDPSQATEQPTTHSSTRSPIAMAAAKPHRPSRERKPITGDAVELHHIMACASPEAIEHLPSNVLGVNVVDGRAPKTHECEVCGLSKMKQQISRRATHEHPATRPFERVCFDIIELHQPALNGHIYILHFYDVYSKFNLVFSTSNKQKATVLPIIRKVHRLAAVQFNQKMTMFWSDNEAAFGKTGHTLKQWCDEEGITLELSSPYTHEQNGAAERSGMSLIIKARALHLLSKLPKELGDYLFCYAGYIANRTPTQSLGWKTPFEVLYGRKPDLSHLHRIGTRAYVLLRNIPRLDKLAPRAFIGYLVGYDSRNIFLIWNSTNNRIYRVRDALFDDSTYYNPGDYKAEQLLRQSTADDLVAEAPLMPREDPDDDYVQYAESLRIASELNVDDNQDEHQNMAEMEALPFYMAQLPTPEDTPAPESPKASTPIPSSPTSEPHQASTSEPHQASTTEPHQASTIDVRSAEESEQEDSTSSENTDIPEYTPFGTSTRPNRPAWTTVTIDADDHVVEGQAPESWHHNQATTGPAGSTTQIDESNILPSGSRRSRRYAAALKRLPELAGYYASFAAASMKKELPEPTTSALHRDHLPPEPRNYQEALGHLYKDGWLGAMGVEFAILLRKGAFRKVLRAQAVAAGKQVIPLKWVFKYKFDEHGYLVKFKARLVVRGDLQTTAHETYAATLAARTFRALMALAAAYNLELRQYDATNAFINALLDDEIYVQCPDGYTDHDHVLLLLRALYGLKEAPRLWYQELVRTLTKLGFTPVPGVECLFTNGKLLVFFYVDDIVTLCLPQYIRELQQLEASLMATYELKALGELHWFLGIRVVRDRPNRTIWLSQESYIEQLASRFNVDVSKKKYPSTPLPTTSILGPNQATETNKQNIMAYQQRVGSIGYAATTLRADVAKAHSKLSEFLTNPSPEHQAAAQHVINYLYGTKNYAIKYSANSLSLTGSVFDASSDAAFADDASRRSSHGYLFILFGGAIDWKATVQRSVTKSTTEAELLAISQAAGLLLWWTRFFTAIELDTEERPTLQCDNLQTVRILTKESMKLDTKLKHVDVHQLWLRQEVEAGRIHVNWVPTAQMPADGLTKILPPQKHENFVTQLGLVRLTPDQLNSLLT